MWSLLYDLHSWTHSKGPIPTAHLPSYHVHPGYEAWRLPSVPQQRDGAFLCDYQPGKCQSRCMGTGRDYRSWKGTPRLPVILQSPLYSMMLRLLALFVPFPTPCHGVLPPGHSSGCDKPSMCEHGRDHPEGALGTCCLKDCGRYRGRETPGQALESLPRN